MCETCGCGEDGQLVRVEDDEALEPDERPVTVADER